MPRMLFRKALTKFIPNFPYYAIREFMKYSFLILISLVFIGISAKSQEKQKLKDLLYSGKLKKDSSGVIRSTDDLSSKIDTTTKKDTAAVVKAKPADVAPMTLEQQQAMVRGDATTTKATTTNTTSASNNNTTASTTDEAKTDNATPAPAVATAPKTNTKLWREYTDAITKSLKDEALKSKQIKKDTYFILVEYEIAPDGQVTVDAVNSTPGNGFLQAQIKQLMDTTPLKLNALTESGGQTAKKVKRKQKFTITKD
jgi:hypothetical protein